MLQTSVTATVWVYGVITFGCAICSILLPIETKGRKMHVSVHYFYLKETFISCKTALNMDNYTGR